MLEHKIETLIAQCSNISLLYVEDDTHTREATLAILDEIFTTIFVAKDGDEGLKLYQENAQTIDLIITDITMPKLNGLEMIERIREENKDVVIIVFSAHNESSYFAQTIEMGVDGY